MLQAIPSSAKLDLKPILDIIRSEQMTRILDLSNGLLSVSINPQTAQRALLLIAQLAQHMPEQVLQHIVPIFTFMGANVVHKDDAYSNRVVTSVRLARRASIHRADHVIRSWRMYFPPCSSLAKKLSSLAPSWYLVSVVVSVSRALLKPK